uniref:AlpA family phage regulatory protein n=1 Tax=Asticcacaulis sp. DW145 TaxID=3095608 RepID=UPI00403F5DD6
MSDVVMLTSLYRSSIYRLIEKGDFPKSIRLSPNRTAWSERAVNDWLYFRAHRDKPRYIPARRQRKISGEAAFQEGREPFLQGTYYWLIPYTLENLRAEWLRGWRMAHDQRFGPDVRHRPDLKFK